MNKLYFIVFLASIFLFTTCEYEPTGDNFVELTPPEDYLPIEILLNDVIPTDTIYVYQNTSISMRINSPKNLQKVIVSIDGEEYTNFWEDWFSFEINPNQLSEGVHTLTLNAVFSSGTGSLAEMMGLESFMGELSWKIYIIHDLQDLFELGYHTNEEGFLEIYWKNFISENLIEKFTVHSVLTQNSDTTIYYATQKSFVDYGYVCGDANYEVTIYLKDGYSFMQQLNFVTPIPSVYFENLGIDNLRIYWDKPFANGRFILSEDNNIIASAVNDTTITIAQFFGENRQFVLTIRPQNAEYDNFHNKFDVWESFCQGIILGLPNFPLYAYNRNDNSLYTSSYNNLIAYNATSMQVINTVSIPGNPWGLSYGGKIASAPHNSTVAAMTGEETWIFNDNSFSNPIIIPLLSGTVNTRLSALTSNDRFFVVEKDANICKVFNSLTGDNIFQFQFTYVTIYTFPDFVTVSEDGHFFCASSENGIEIFEINGTSTNLLYTDTRQYKGAMFVPSQPDRLLVRVDGNIEIREIPSFNQIQILDVSANSAILCNIDPASMSLLYYQNDSLRVCKIDNITETIFKIRSDEVDCKMFNNKLLTRGNEGICLDINPYIGK